MGHIVTEAEAMGAGLSSTAFLAAIGDISQLCGKHEGLLQGVMGSLLGPSAERMLANTAAFGAGAGGMAGQRYVLKVARLLVRPKSGGAPAAAPSAAPAAAAC